MRGRDKIIISRHPDHSSYFIKFSGPNFKDFCQSLKNIGATYQPKLFSWCLPSLSLVSLFVNDIGLVPDKDFDLILEGEGLEKEGIISAKAFLPETARKIPIPDVFSKNPPLAEYQKQDAITMASVGRILNANDCGMGKTYTAIKAASILWSRKDIDRILIITVGSVLYNWKYEIEKFFDFQEDITVDIWKSEDCRDFSTSAPIVIMTYQTWYALVRRFYKQATGKATLSDNVRKPVINLSHWGSSRLIILDESHRIKNPSSKWYRSLIIHREYFNYRFLLTGTPATKGVENLYTQINFIDPMAVFNLPYTKFISMIAHVGNRFSRYAINSYIPEKVEFFLKHISKVYFRRLKKDYLSLPELGRKKIRIPLSGVHETIYRICVNGRLQKIMEEDGCLRAVSVKNALPYIALAIHNPAILLTEDKQRTKISEIFYHDLENLVKNFSVHKMEKTKILKEIISEILEEDSSAKIVVWDVHPLTIDTLGEILEAPVLHGKIDLEQRNKIVEEFRKNKNNVLVANPAILGVGVNLQFVSHAIHFSRTFSVEEQIQADGRLVRPGMRGNVMSYILLYDGTFEVSQDAIIDSGQALNDLVGKWEKDPELLKNFLLGR